MLHLASSCFTQRARDVRYCHRHFYEYGYESRKPKYVLIDTIVRRRIGTGCWSPPDPLIVERDLTFHIYNNRISEYLVYGNSAFWPDGRILGCEFPVRNTHRIFLSFSPSSHSYRHVRTRLYDLLYVKSNRVAWVSVR